MSFLLIRLIESANAMYHPMDTNHAIYESCADAVARGGIRPNPDEPITILLRDGTNTSCEMKRLKKRREFRGQVRCACGALKMQLLL